MVIDTREQRGFKFIWIESVRKGLKTGDYSLVGFEDRVAVERKSKSDGYGVVGSGRARFERELVRLAVLDRAAIVIECSLHEFCVPPARTRIDQRMAVNSFISWSCTYRIPVFWCGSREYAEQVTLRFLTSYLKHCAEVAL